MDNANFTQFGTAVADKEASSQFDKPIEWEAKLTDEDDTSRPSLFRLLPEGEYEFTVENTEPGETKTGKRKMTVQLIIDNPDGQGKARVDDGLILTEKAKWKLCTFWKAIGMWETAKTEGMKWKKALGKKGRLKLEQREYNGKTFNNVKAYVMPSQPSVTANNGPTVTKW